jgi:hypothetical protein
MKRDHGTTCAILCVAASAFGSAPAFAVHNDGIFQIDGDPQTSTCGTAFGSGVGCSGDDWDRLYTCSADGSLGCTASTPGVGNGAAEIAPLVVDLSSADTIFTGGGSKDQLDMNQWNWKAGSVPDKDNLVESFAAVYEPTTGARAGHKLLYFGANRFAVNGDAQIGFWFLQNGASLKADGTFQDTSGNPAHHAVGDILILSNFVQGGGSSNIQMFVVSSVNSDGSVSLSQTVNNTAGANGVCNPNDSACAATNGSVVPALDPDFTAKSGASTGFYPTVGFFEGGLDLSAFGLGGECFPTFMVETRSSQSITAVLKDFTIGSFERCVAAIRTEIHSAPDNSDADLQGTSITPGTTIHDLAIVTGAAGAPVPTGTVTFSLFSTADCTGASSSQTVLLTVGTTDSRANSTAFTPLPGNLSYQATYNGDSNYRTTVTSNCEPLTVNKFQSSIATHILKASDGSEVTDSLIDLAGAATVSVRDQAIVTKNPAGGGPTPTGTVTFQLFHSGSCTGTAATTETITLSSATCSGNPCAIGLSSVFALDANTLSYKATYSGDSNFLPSSVSRCEPVCAIDTTK